MADDQENRLQKLEQDNQQLRALLRNTMDRWDDERAVANATKNRVPGGFYMMSREAEKNLRALQRENATASLVFSVMRESMQIGTNAVTISHTALARIIGKSRRTVVRAARYLEDHQYVQVLKSGTANTYVVNAQIAFAGRPGQRQAVFSSTVVAHECEQEEGWDQVKKLKAVPVIATDERPVLNSSEELPPPDQLDMPLE